MRPTVPMQLSQIDEIHIAALAQSPDFTIND
jgi:hypothetical protein